MKKYIITLLLVAFIIPSVALASWWNPFSWFNSWTFHKTDPETQILENRVKELEEKLNNASTSTQIQNELNSQTEKPKPTTSTNIKTDSTKPVANKTTIVNIPTPPVQVVDVCLNIEGIQPQIPSGYSSVSNICTLIDVKDYCPNISGTQSKIPEGYIFYKNTGKCLTEKELDAIENTQSQEDAREAQCQNAKEEVVFYNQQLEGIVSKYANLFLKEVTQGNGGADDFPNIKCNSYKCSSYGGTIPFQEALDYQQDAETDSLNKKISTAQAEVQLYCD